MQTIELTSPAKLNLFLDVVKKRSDGYHDIVTVFEKIDLCDRIKLTESSQDIEITSSSYEIPSGEDNLVYRACSLLRKTYRVSKGARIHIEKEIPIAAGLGGGSSNAATTLKGLNRLWKLNIQNKELSDFGKKIGADVPFFIFNHAFAIGRERGDEIEPIKSDLELWHVIISLPFKILTKEIYNKVSLNLTAPYSDVKIMVRAIEKKDFVGVKKNLYNALEPIAVKKVTDISMAKDFIKKMGFDAVGVTGSGPTIFVLVQKRKEAERLRDELLSPFVSGRFHNEWKIFVAKTLKIPI